MIRIKRKDKIAHSEFRCYGNNIMDGLEVIRKNANA